METGEQNISLVEKLYNIMSELDYIQKDKKNTFHGYTYASEAAIKKRSTRRTGEIPCVVLSDWLYGHDGRKGVRCQG
jgi:hypothetical protein